MRVSVFFTAIFPVWCSWFLVFTQGTLSRHHNPQGKLLRDGDRMRERETKFFTGRYHHAHKLFPDIEIENAHQHFTCRKPWLLTQRVLVVYGDVLL